MDKIIFDEKYDHSLKNHIKGNFIFLCVSWSFIITVIFVKIIQGYFNNKILIENELIILIIIFSFSLYETTWWFLYSQTYHLIVKNDSFIIKQFRKSKEVFFKDIKEAGYNSRKEKRKMNTFYITKTSYGKKYHFETKHCKEIFDLVKQYKDKEELQLKINN